MHLKDVPVPEPQDGEVLIRVGKRRHNARGCLGCRGVKNDAVIKT